MNNLRRVLTMLGIVTGVASVIAQFWRRDQAATQRIQDQIASVEGDIIIIIPGSTTSSRCWHCGDVV